MTGNHVLPELPPVCPGPSTVTTVYTQQPGHRHGTKGFSGSWAYNRHRALILFFLSFSLTQVKTLALMIQLKAVFLTKFYCLMIQPKEVQHAHT